MKGMALKWGKGRSILALIAVLFLNVQIMQEMCLYPIVNTLYETFPGETFAMSLVLNMPAFLAVVISLMVPAMLKKISHRGLIVISLIVGGIGVICGGLVENVWYIVAMRTLAGIAYAIDSVMFTIIITDIFYDETKRAAFLGIFNTFTSVFGALMSLVAGVLAAAHWTGAFTALTIFAIPMVLLGLLFIPGENAIDRSKFQPEETAAESQVATGGKRPLGTRFVLLVISFSLFNLALCGWSYFQSVFLAEFNIGGPALAGTLTSVYTVFSAISAACFVLVYTKLKGKTGLPAAIVMLIALSLPIFNQSVTGAVITSACSGAAYGMMITHLYSYTAAIVPAERLDTGVSIAVSCGSLGLVIGNFLYPVVQQSMGSTVYIFYIAAALMVASVIIEILAKDPLRKKN